ncbi:MAG: MATE family efflux transporter [Firmicutes bacterium]|nr:MATE family efflux transporter [Bacillota bacterium]HOB35814.1 MATE family efflux transporter [Bacillota bacterium]HPZ91230.1 MATE family efflux transporter [Bacillota bacterium]HQE02352.1 MATE family efflux transporter [Bacillota bacterium]
MAASRGLFAAKDLTQGTPWKRIVEFAVPMLIGNIAQQLYNTADSIIVGRYIGDNALAAVGSAMPVLYLLLVLFAGIAVGAGVAVAQFFGARDREQLSRTIGTCITLTALSSAIIMVIGPAVSRPLLQFLNTPASIIDWCADYLNIFFLGIAGFSYYNIFAGILRGLGDSVSALVFLLAATALNVGLDILFVSQFGLGVPGVALATVLAQGISAALCFLKLRSMTENFDLNWSMLKPSRELTLTIMKLGLPSGLTQAIFSLAMVAVQSLINSFGEMVIACNVIVMRVDGFAMMPNFSFGAAMTTFAGQNIGAGRMDRVRQGSKQGTLIAVGVSATITVLLLLFGRHLMNVFTDTPELVALSMRMMRILALGYVAVAVTQCLTGVMRGAGDAMTPMWISLIAAVLLRVPTAYGLAYLTRSALYPNGRPESPFISLLVSWTLGAVITAVIFKRGAWRQRMLTLERKRVAET